MDMPINFNEPRIMHIDLNSCFAIIEQQANPLLRHKPVAIAAYDSPRGMVIASSYEAKALGIKLGVNVREARLLCKDVLIMTPDPEKYFDAHRRFKKVLLNYTDRVTPKSVDEFVIDFRDSRAVQAGTSLECIGRQIKHDIKQSLGEYVTVNIGIGPNRFLAKLAAGLDKPDGLDVITGDNLRAVYENLDLTDLPGINVRYQARLNIARVYTPLQFLDAPVLKLRKQVFKSINGFYWYLRLRGHEVDQVDFGRKSFGQQYALGEKTYDRQKLSRLLMKLCEKTGRRLRGADYIASGIHLWLQFENRTSWAKGRKVHADIYSTQDIYLQAHTLLNEATIPCKVANIGVSVFNLHPASPQQLGLFDDSRLDTKSLARAADTVNDRYGEFTMVPAIMANMHDVIIKRVAFGSIRDL
jgi:DNA polymerase IV